MAVAAEGPTPAMQWVAVRMDRLGWSGSERKPSNRRTLRSRNGHLGPAQHRRCAASSVRSHGDLDRHDLEQIVVVDCDLGVSGASTDREGFRKLVAEVGIGRAGIVLGLEVSRLARNSTDWHRLLEICALSETLILDEDGLYDPTGYNDRLLLGLKGTLSEAELHMLRARLRGGLLAKARRGELQIGLPVGLVYDELGRVVLHPDAQVRETIALFFRTFFRTGAARATVKYFTEHAIPFPAPAHTGAKTAQVVWGRLTLSRAVHNPAQPALRGRIRLRTTQQPQAA